ncbi:MAG: thiamine pyrophosphate-binding protein [Spirochaetes bacterium]|nr:thiamine pyrophosphate-binding protein [Spirochaetota bacterium]
MKLSDYIVRFLEENGIDIVFGYIGGAITHLVQSVHDNAGVRFVQVYHEQTAAFAAEGYARRSGKFGVAMATSGPGATNLITGIGDAFFDSIPVLYITGQVNTYEYKYDKKIRQQGFQETDIVSIVRPITKYAALISNPTCIRTELEKALFHARSGRPGPVVLDIPMDVQRAEIDPETLPRFIVPVIPDTDGVGAALEQIVLAVQRAQRPLLLAGGGVISSGAKDELLRFAQTNGIPVVTSLMGKGVFPEEDRLFVGMIGSYGNRCANIALANTDLLIVVGSRLDTRQTGTLLTSFVRQGDIVHVDIDPAELSEHRIDRKYKVCMDVKHFLLTITGAMKTKPECGAWLSHIASLKKAYSQQSEVSRFVTNSMPYRIIDMLNRYSQDDQQYFVDIGQNQMWSAQGLRIRDKQRFYTSGGMAPMGYAIPAAIGASFAGNFKEHIFAVVGDGGLHISSQALLLLSQYQLPIKVIVMNNQSLGMITQFQDLYFNKNRVGTTKDSGYLIPDLAALATAYFLPHFIIDKNNINDASYLEKILTDRTAAVIECRIGEDTTVSPKISVNTPIEDVSPKLDRDEMKKAMVIDLYDGEK